MDLTGLNVRHVSGSRQEDAPSSLVSESPSKSTVRLKGRGKFHYEEVRPVLRSSSNQAQTERSLTPSPEPSPRLEKGQDKQRPEELHHSLKGGPRFELELKDVKSVKKKPKLNSTRKRTRATGSTGLPSPKKKPTLSGGSPEDEGIDDDETQTVSSPKSRAGIQQAVQRSRRQRLLPTKQTATTAHKAGLSLSPCGSRSASPSPLAANTKAQKRVTSPTSSLLAESKRHKHRASAHAGVSKNGRKKRIRGTHTAGSASAAAAARVASGASKKDEADDELSLTDLQTLASLASTQASQYFMEEIDSLFCTPPPTTLSVTDDPIVTPGDATAVAEDEIVSQPPVDRQLTASPRTLFRTFQSTKSITQQGREYLASLSGETAVDDPEVRYEEEYDQTNLQAFISEHLFTLEASPVPNETPKSALRSGAPGSSRASPGKAVRFADVTPGEQQGPPIRRFGNQSKKGQGSNKCGGRTTEEPSKSKAIGSKIKSIASRGRRATRGVLGGDGDDPSDDEKKVIIGIPKDKDDSGDGDDSDSEANEKRDEKRRHSEGSKPQKAEEGKARRGLPPVGSSLPNSTTTQVTGPPTDRSTLTGDLLNSSAYTDSGGVQFHPNPATIPISSDIRAQITTRHVAATPAPKGRMTSGRFKPPPANPAARDDRADASMFLAGPGPRTMHDDMKTNSPAYTTVRGVGSGAPARDQTTTQTTGSVSFATEAQRAMDAEVDRLKAERDARAAASAKRPRPISAHSHFRPGGDDKWEENLQEALAKVQSDGAADSSSEEEEESVPEPSPFRATRATRARTVSTIDPSVLATNRASTGNRSTADPSLFSTGTRTTADPSLFSTRNPPTGDTSRTSTRNPPTSSATPAKRRSMKPSGESGEATEAMEEIREMTLESIEQVREYIENERRELDRRELDLIEQVSEAVGEAEAPEEDTVMEDVSGGEKKKASTTRGKGKGKAKATESVLKF